MCLYGGGASDYPQFLQKHLRGTVIGFAIDKYSYIHARKLPPYFDYKTKLVYSEIEHVKDNRDIKHKAIKSIIETLDLSREGLEIHHISDLPSSSGLGSSSAFIVSALQALNRLNYNYILSQSVLRRYASSVEMTLLCENIGYQDSLWATYGDCRQWEFRLKDENLQIFSQIMPDFTDHVLLFYTGISRKSSDVVGSYVDKLADSKEQLALLNIADMAAESLLKGTNISLLGDLLKESWILKKAISPNISVEKVDYLIDRFENLGCLGAKLCGGGGGGSIACIAYPDVHKEIIDFAVENGCVHIPFKVDSKGCVIL